MDISKTIQQYKDWQQLAEYATAQEQTIIQLSKKIQKLEEEKNSLKQQVVVGPNIPSIANASDSGQQDSEYICNLEISKLKQVALMRELTLEECRKLTEYFKILQTVNSKSKDAEREVKNLGNEDLLKIVESNGNGTK